METFNGTLSDGLPITVIAPDYDTAERYALAIAQQEGAVLLFLDAE